PDPLNMMGLVDNRVVRHGVVVGSMEIVRPLVDTARDGLGPFRAREQHTARGQDSLVTS
ncbi:MAG: hypothetical protein HN341_17980, partial [Verrucomicrobia bacterium]|nr:hypothetical protein [Verrucomicrobiota bacterium]